MKLRLTDYNANCHSPFVMNNLTVVIAKIRHQPNQPNHPKTTQTSQKPAKPSENQRKPRKNICFFI